LLPPAPVAVLPLLPAPPPMPEAEPAAPWETDPPLLVPPPAAAAGPLPPAEESTAGWSSGCGLRQAPAQQARIAHGNARQRARSEESGFGTNSSRRVWCKSPAIRGTPRPGQTHFVPPLAQCRPRRKC
jgi:hypothetical protein